MPPVLRTITAAEHRAYVATHPWIPLQQTPGWGAGIEPARTESVGWFDGGTLIGAGLVRFRGLPRLPLRSVAVFESGPDIDWTGQRRPGYDLADWLAPLVEHLRGRGAISVRVSPPVASREWWAVDPAQQATGRELVRWQPEPVPRQQDLAQRRLTVAGASLLPTLPALYTADVMVRSGVIRRRVTDMAQGGALLAGYHVRSGALEELGAVRNAVAAAHPGLRTPSAADSVRHWRAIAGDDPASVKLLVVEQRGDIVYGGLVAVVGERAWDLSPALPQPDADRPEVQALRHHMIAHATLTGSSSLAVATVLRGARAPIRTPAPGWPPVRLRRFMGTWHLPVRSGWHSAVAPVVDRIVL